jgi:PEP-CTERM motif
MQPSPKLATPTQTRRLFAAFAALPALVITPAAYAASSSWNVDAAGNWSLVSNWADSVIPGATSGTTSTDVATFGRSILGASRIVTFDTAYNLGGITFDNASAVANRVFTVSASTLGSVTPALNLSNNFLYQNIGSGTAVSGVNVLDVAMVLNGSATFTNTYGNSVVNIGMSSGASANAISTAVGLGNVDVVLGGTSTGSNLWSMRINQASGTTVRMVKEGSGFWQINGPSSGSGTMTGGLLIRQGGVSLGRSTPTAFGSGPIVLGDSGTTAADIYLQTGSGVTVSSNITIAASAATNVIFERLGTGGDSIYQGTITLERDLVLRQRTAGTARNLNIASNSVLTGTGDVIIDTTFTNATGVVILGGGSGTGTGSINMIGKLINRSSTGAAGVSVTGKILGNVTEVVQNSASSPMTISGTANLFDKTTVSAGSLITGATGRLGTGDITVASGATLTLGNSASIQDSSAMFFGSTSLINLNFSGADTLSMLALRSLSDTYIAPGTYSAGQLNSFFGGSSFAGTGSLTVLSAIPEPSSFAALAGLGILGFAATRRRARQ